jgi:adenine deaminase
MKILAAAACFLAALFSAGANAETVVVTAGKLVDVLTGREIDSPAIFIENGRITSIADARTVRWGAGVKHIAAFLRHMRHRPVLHEHRNFPG